MKIKSIRFFGFQQFQDTFLDFTHPETGEPLEQICLIGKNGTGKSTVLKILNEIIHRTFRIEQTGLVAAHIDFGIKEYLLVYALSTKRFERLYAVFEVELLKVKNWEHKIIALSDSGVVKEGSKFNFEIPHYSNEDFADSPTFWFRNVLNEFSIYCPAETLKNDYLNIFSVPNATLDEAISQNQLNTVMHEVSAHTLSSFWKTLIWHIKIREWEQNVFENQPENLQKTKQQLLDEFNESNPKILEEIGALWNRILEPTGLYFDVAGASIPIQLNDNLLAYIKLKSTGEVIQYNQLSSGIRNFIFKLGHIMSLYFNREIDRGFLFVDEPENSLFPDFLYGLIDVYGEITTDKRGQNNTQRFFATHNPIIAAQFQPHERIVLDWDEKGTVIAHKGVAPIGDDPNDLLKKDFQVRSLMGKQGEDKFKEYLHLKKQLRAAQTPESKMEIASKMSTIGREYEFEGQ